MKEVKYLIYPSLLSASSAKSAGKRPKPFLSSTLYKIKNPAIIPLQGLYTKF